MPEPFEMELAHIQPSQLYISKKKLAIVNKSFDPKDKNSLGIIPVKKLNDEIIYSDGHTRAVAAYLAGYEKVLVEWEGEDLDWELYEICVKWCKDEQIYSAKDLVQRIISHKDYELVWYKKCEVLQKEISLKRQGIIK
jgi:hypothetical protein